MASRRVRIILQSVSIAAFCLATLTVGLYQRVEARAAVDRAQRADAIIVLGSAVWTNGRASPALNARIQRAIELYRAGYAPRLILCGGVGNNPPSEAQVMKNIALNAGLPEEVLILEDQSHSTEENLANAKKIIDARGWRTALIVSAPYHLLRAELIAQDLGINAVGSPTRNDPTFSAASLRFWYTTRESLALIWYYSAKLVGESSWLYVLLKGKI